MRPGGPGYHLARGLYGAFRHCASRPALLSAESARIHEKRTTEQCTSLPGDAGRFPWWVGVGRDSNHGAGIRDFDWRQLPISIASSLSFLLPTSYYINGVEPFQGGGDQVGYSASVKLISLDRRGLLG